MAAKLDWALDLAIFSRENKSYIRLYSCVLVGELSTSSLKSIAQGFFAMTAAISLFSILAIIRGGDAWLGLLYLLILLMPLSGAAYLWRRGKNTFSLKVDSYEKGSNFLFALQGVALACWIYDVATTYYAIDVARIAYEVNPLGWPLGAIGALVYYAPTVLLTYVLLFRIREKISLYAAIPMTLVVLCMGVMNLNAGIGNFHFFLTSAWLPTEIRYNLLVVIVAVDLVYAATLATAARRQIFHEQGNLNPSKKRLP